MAGTVKLTLNSTDYVVNCSGCIVGWKNNNTVKPTANGTVAAKAQTQSFENPTYILQGVMFTNNTGELTYDNLITIAKTKYDPDTAASILTLTVEYPAAEDGGVGTTNTTLNGSDGLNPIKVVVDSFNFPIDTRQSRSGYLVSGNINLKETR